MNFDVFYVNKQGAYKIYAGQPKIVGSLLKNKVIPVPQKWVKN